LKFKHHDAGEDARASAEVVLRAERLLGAGVFESNPAKIRSFRRESLLNVDGPSPKEWTRPFDVTPASEEGFVYRLGQTEITAGNIANNHIYLRGFFERFPAEAIGGSNKANAAACEIVIEWGGTERVVTDLDGKKKFFRKRSWIRDFFATHDVVVGTVVFVDQIGPLRYRLTVAER
jgi:hypothetical protein